LISKDADHQSSLFFMSFISRIQPQLLVL